MSGKTALVESTRARVTLLKRRLEAETQQGIARLVGILVLGALVALIVFAVGAAIGFVVVLRGAPELLRTGVSAGLLALAAALVLSSLGHAAQAFFSAKDLWFWDSAPAPTWARFLDRSIETGIAALPAALTLFSVGLVGLVLGGRLGVGAALRVVVAVGLVAVVPMFLGVLLAHLGGAVLPAGKLRRVSILLLGVGVAGALIWFRSARVEKMLSPEGANELLRSARAVKAVGPEALPSALGARFVIDGELLALLGMVAWSASVLGLAYLAHSLLSRRARDLAVDESPVGILRGSARDRALKAFVAPIKKELRPLVEKDLLAFLRDPAQWGQVVLLLGVGLLYLVNASMFREGFSQMPEVGQAMLPAMHTGLITFISAGLAARFAFPQVGLEGPAVWIVDGSPLHARSIMTAKWIAALPVVAIYPTSVALFGGIVLDMHPAIWLSTSIMCASVCAGVTAFGVGRGALKPLFDAASLSELAMGPGAISTMLAATALAFFASMSALVGGGVVAFSGRADAWSFGVLAALAGSTLVPSALALIVGKRALDRGALAFVRRREDEAERAYLMRDQQTVIADE